MKKIKHSKYKNTGILFEMLVRKLTSETLTSNKSVTIDIIKKYFGRNTELSKELQLYNSLVKEHNDMNFLIKTNMNSNYHYNAYGYTFLPGVCCKVVDVKDGQNVFCTTKYSALVPMMNKSFCLNHIRAEVKQYNNEKKLLEKQKEKEQKKEQKLLEKEKEKEQKLLEKQKEKQKEKALKCEQKKTVEKNTIIKQNIQIGEFSTTITDTTCCSILKSGAKKGQQCGAKGKYNGLCARHLPNNKETKSEEPKTEETKTEEPKTDI